MVMINIILMQFAEKVQDFMVQHMKKGEKNKNGICFKSK